MSVVESQPEDDGLNDSTGQHNIKKVIGKFLVVTVNIEGKLISWLIDTSSQFSTIIESYFRELLKSEPKLIYTCINKWIRMSGVNNLPIPYIAYIEVKINTADNFGKDRKMRVCS